MVASLVAFLNAGLDIVLPLAWQGPLRLAAGGVLALQGGLLATNWLGARSHLARRRPPSRTRAQSVAATVWQRFVQWTLKTIGLVWLAVGAIEIIRGATTG